MAETNTASETPARADPRWRRTRQAIIAAGESLFGQHPADGVSIDDLVRLARISKQSFYNHFPDKDALARELLRLARAELDRLVTAANQGEADPAKRLATGIAVYSAQALLKPHQGQLVGQLMLIDASADSEANSPVVADVIAGLSKGRLAVFTPETGVGFILGVGEALVRKILTDPDRETAAIICQQYTTLLLRAFGLSPLESEMIAAEASERIIRRG
ncbi:TetR/AcrR family transcriptional regulator [Novosphingobium sp.]|uniref:TetR/AcrR family transcriptional regulator n=1 Tax=Novosphingobium sp. TaxID=1874826 RepID=UPI00286E642A|nr:TetR/AcrR family transcriptional regulator [Novosphingobium sp.]